MAGGSGTSKEVIGIVAGVVVAACAVIALFYSPGDGGGSASRPLTVVTVVTTVIEPAQGTGTAGVPPTQGRPRESQHPLGYALLGFLIILVACFLLGIPMPELDDVGPLVLLVIGAFCAVCVCLFYVDHNSTSGWGLFGVIVMATATWFGGMALGSWLGDNI